MRFFQIEGAGTRIVPGPLRIVAERCGEGNLDDPIGIRPEDIVIMHVTEYELLAMVGGRHALELWRAGDDSAHARAIVDELAIEALDDELSGRG